MLVKTGVSLAYVIPYLFDIISRLQALLFSGVFGQPGGRWHVWFVGRCQGAALHRTCLEGRFGARSWNAGRHLCL